MVNSMRQQTRHRRGMAILSCLFMAKLLLDSASSSISRRATCQQGSMCICRAMQGTSMATPLVAASATLVRQYFLDGFYPSGAATAANAYAPSGALVKVLRYTLLPAGPTHLTATAS